MKTKDGLTIYHFDGHLRSMSYIVAGPAGYDDTKLRADALPEGFRWVSDDEWLRSLGENVGEVV